MMMDLRTKYSAIWVLFDVVQEYRESRCIYGKVATRNSSPTLVKEDLHSVEACLVERFKDVERGKEERAGPTRWVEDCHFSDGFPEGAEKFGPLAIFNDILCELADVEVVGNQVVDVADFSVSEFSADGFITLPACDDFPPNFCW